MHKHVNMVPQYISNRKTEIFTFNYLCTNQTIHYATTLQLNVF